MEKLIHIREASELLNISEEEMNNLVEEKKIEFVVSSMTKMIKLETILHLQHGCTDIFDPIESIKSFRGEGNKIENLTLVSTDKTK